MQLGVKSLHTKDSDSHAAVSKGWSLGLDIVPKNSIYRLIKNIYTEPKKVRYFDSSFDYSMDDNDTIKRSKTEGLPGR